MYVLHNISAHVLGDNLDFSHFMVISIAYSGEQCYNNAVLRKEEMHMKQALEIPPFPISKNVYFVGTHAVSVHLIDTGDGLIMIDTGYPHMRSQILENFSMLGFNPEDIRVILHTHGHYDHIGSTVAFKHISGAKTYISRADNEIVNGHLNLSWAEEMGFERLCPFDSDVLLEDGDCVRLGNTQIRCLLVPGHTEGTMAFIFQTELNGKQYIAAMHGGVGTNSMEGWFLKKHGLSTACRADFRAGLRRLKKLSVDIVLGNHPDQNDTGGKAKRVLAGETEACVDPHEWQFFLENCEMKLDEMLAREQGDG